MTARLAKTRASGAAGVSFDVEVIEEDDDALWALIQPGTPHVHQGWAAAVQTQPALLGLFRHRGYVLAVSEWSGKVDVTRSVSADPAAPGFDDVEVDVVWEWNEPARIVDVDELEALGLPGTSTTGT